MIRGITYLNFGFNYLVRLCVSLNSLRKVYDGNVTIICVDEESYEQCLKLASWYNVDVKLQILKDFIPAKFWLHKCRMIEYSPYDVTLHLDSDTLILKNPSKLLDLAEKNDFVGIQFNGRTTHTWDQIRRFKSWENKGIDKDRLEKLKIKNPVMVDGNFAFSKNSEFAKNWYSLVQKHINLSLPTEAVLQLYLFDYKHTIVGCGYNASARHDKTNRYTVIIHYYGQKHGVFYQGNPVWNNEYWWKEFDWIKDKIEDWIKYDKTVIRCLPLWEKWKIDKQN